MWSWSNTLMEHCEILMKSGGRSLTASLFLPAAHVLGICTGLCINVAKFVYAGNMRIHSWNTKLCERQAKKKAAVKVDESFSRIVQNSFNRRETKQIFARGGRGKERATQRERELLPSEKRVKRKAKLARGQGRIARQDNGPAGSINPYLSTHSMPIQITTEGGISWNTAAAF